MISQIHWLVPNHVLYWKMSGEIPGSEIEEMSKFIAEQLEINKRKVHLVIDAVGIRDIDHTSRIARDALGTLAKKPWIGKVVTIIHNYQIQIHLNNLSAAFGLNWHNVSTMNDATRVLKNADSTLHSIPKLFTKPLIAHSTE